jgi:alkaline phosphatase D
VIDRRQLLRSLAAAGGVALLPRMLRAAATPLPEYPFRLGVSSGFATDASVVLWTRLLPQPDQPGGGMPAADWPLRYEVASDEKFRRIVKRGDATAEAGFAHSVHLEVKGLESARDYWYRFTAGDHMSAVGRTRTLPAPRAQVERLRIAVASCQNYEHGHFAALRYLAADAPDMVLHLGDYIYEGSPAARSVRPQTGGRCMTLEDYRRRYALYQSDAALQAAHAAAPWFVTWDDHEVTNDYAGPLAGRQEEAFLARRAAAYQAWYEHLPAPPSMAPRDGAMRIFWRAQLGRLATLHLLDQRQYRSPEACPRPPQLGGLRVGPECADLADPTRSMLGSAQEQWLGEGLQKYPGAWTLLGQGTPFTPINQGTAEAPQYSTDSWSGYPVARQRLVDSLRQTRAANPVLLGGDIHASLVARIHAVPERLDSPLVAAEFCATSISSNPQPQATLDKWVATNANLQRLDGSRRGYLALTLTGKQLRADLVAVDDVTRPDAARLPAASYVVEAGNPAILPA